MRTFLVREKRTTGVNVGPELAVNFVNNPTMSDVTFHGTEYYFHAASTILKIHGQLLGLAMFGDSVVTCGQQEEHTGGKLSVACNLLRMFPMLL